MVGVGIHLFPYSPRWLCMAGRDPTETLSALAALRRRPTDDYVVQTEWKEIVTEVKVQEIMTKRRHGDAKGFRLELLGWSDLLRPKYIRRTAVAAAIPFFQQVYIEHHPKS